MNYARLLKRDLATTYPLALEARLVVERYAWSAEGGPSLATISAYGSELALWELLECLRCPVEIGDEADELHWWGYVAGVELQIGAVSMAVDLDSMANRVAVAYAYVPEGAGTPGVRATTSWAQDNDSVAEYGTFEELMSAATSETTAATRMRDARLAFAKYPVPAPTVSPGRSDLRATLNCRGWWSTLARRYDSRA